MAKTIAMRAGKSGSGFNWVIDGNPKLEFKLKGIELQPIQAVKYGATITLKDGQSAETARMRIEEFEEEIWSRASRAIGVDWRVVEAPTGPEGSQEEVEEGSEERANWDRFRKDLEQYCLDAKGAAKALRKYVFESEVDHQVLQDLARDLAASASFAEQTVLGWTKDPEDSDDD